MNTIALLSPGSKWFNVVLVLTACDVNVAVSGPQAVVFNPSNTPRAAVPITNLTPWGATTTPYPGVAQWVWTQNPVSGLQESITLRHEFNLVCPNQPLTVRTNVDDRFTLELNGVTSSGTDWHTTKVFTVSTAGV
mgnify:FL=1